MKEDTELIIKIIEEKIETVNKTIAASGTNTAISIEKLEKTIREHNGRLRDVELCQLKALPTIRAVEWARQHWYVCAIILMLSILILIPVAEIIGIRGVVGTLMDYR